MYNLSTTSTPSVEFKAAPQSPGWDGRAAYQVVRASGTSGNFSVTLQVTIGDSGQWDDVATVDQSEVNEVEPFVTITGGTYRWVHNSGVAVVARLV